MYVFSVELQPRKMQFDQMHYRDFEERQSASRDAYKPNGFLMISGAFLME